MMNVFFKPRILLACLAGIVMVTAALINTPKSTADNPNDSSLQVIVGNAPDRNFITVTDKNKDGIPDWQEALANAEDLLTLNASSTSGYEEPETLTDKLSVDFARDLMSSRLYGTLDNNKSLLLTNAKKQIAEQAIPDLYTENDLITVNHSDNDVLREYSNGVTAITFKYSVDPDTRDTLTIIEDAIVLDNEDVLNELNPIIETYENILSDTLKIPVPEKMIDQHLDLVNGYLIFITDLKGIQQLFNDPLLGLVHAQSFLIDQNQLGTAILSFYREVYKLGARFDDTDITSQFVRFE